VFYAEVANYERYAQKKKKKKKNTFCAWAYKLFPILAIWGKCVRGLSQFPKPKRQAGPFIVRSVSLSSPERERGKLAMGMRMAIRVFLPLLLLLASAEHSFSLYEDQVGLMDW
jgi:hypothetical protein